MHCLYANALVQPCVQHCPCYMAWKTKVHTWCRHCHLCINAPMWREKRWLQGIIDPPSYIHVFCSPYWLFCLTKFEKNTNLSDTVSLWYESWEPGVSLTFFFVSPELSSGRDLVIQMSVRRAVCGVRRPLFFGRSISREPYNLPWWYLVCGWV